MLSEPGPAATYGGRFSTTEADGAVRAHELRRGDAILFCSETVHYSVWNLPVLYWYFMCF